MANIPFPVEADVRQFENNKKQKKSQYLRLLYDILVGIKDNTQITRDLVNKFFEKKEYKGNFGFGSGLRQA